MKNFIYSRPWNQKVILSSEVNQKDINRLIFVIRLSAITVNPVLNNIEAMISYAFLGKSKITTMIKRI